MPEDNMPAEFGNNRQSVELSNNRSTQCAQTS